MKGVRKILVPIDCSDVSRRAVEYAQELAGLWGADLELLCVCMRPVEYAPLDRAIWGSDYKQHEVERRVRDASQQELDRFVAKLPPKARSARARLELGTPYDVIVDTARKEGHDLIVMGSHGRTGAKHILMGSVAERVVRHAPCPVLVVR